MHETVTSHSRETVGSAVFQLEADTLGEQAEQLTEEHIAEVNDCPAKMRDVNHL